MANISPEDVLVSGLTPTYESAGAGGDVLLNNDGRCVLYVKNEGTSGVLTITITTPVTLGGLAVADRTVEVAQAAEGAIGRLDPTVYGENVAIATDHQDAVTYAWMRP